MNVVKKLGERVEREHNQFLRDAQRIEDRSANAINGSTGAAPPVAVDFESLVGRPGTSGSAKTQSTENASWDDDVWSSIFNNAVRFFPVMASGEFLTSRIAFYTCSKSGSSCPVTSLNNLAAGIVDHLKSSLSSECIPTTATIKTKLIDAGESRYYTYEAYD